MKDSTEIYTLAGGCFWCLDTVFRRLRGVQASVCGYSGGEASEAEYYTVSSGSTKHAEAVQVSFEPSVLPREVLLDIFFLIHDPTTKDRQGADVGPQYRSAMFYVNEQQKQDFQSAVERAKTLWGEHIVTELNALEKFYEAEPEHQDYFSNNPTSGYCSAVIAPKIAKAREAYGEWFR